MSSDTISSDMEHMATMGKLPIALEREPLIDALFEVRMDNAGSLVDILPGMLFSEYGAKPGIERLPAADVPQLIRENDPNFRYTPTRRLHIDGYVVALSDRSIAVSCQMPYPKWSRFKQEILRIINLVGKLEVAGNVERYSLKYVNLIEAATPKEQTEKINLEIQLGPLQVASDQFNLRVQNTDGDTLHILTVVTGATVRGSEVEEKMGVVVDVDSIRNIPPTPFVDFMRNLEDELETLRQENKAHFFGCLKEETINDMGPIYE